MCELSGNPCSSTKAAPLPGKSRTYRLPRSRETRCSVKAGKSVLWESVMILLLLRVGHWAQCVRGGVFMSGASRGLISYRWHRELAREELDAKLKRKLPAPPPTQRAISAGAIQLGN